MLDRHLRAGWLAAALIATLPAAMAWEPHPDAEAHQVLRDARKDAAEGRLDQAAEKHLWFHEHALARDPALVGVRVSFALHDWVALAQRHPPAMAQLLAVRDRAVEQVEAGGSRGQRALSDVLRINAYLGQPESTREAFTRFAQRDPALAEDQALDALPALIKLNEFELAARHLDTDAVLDRLERVYQSMQQMPRKLSDAERALMTRASQRYLDVRLARVVLVLAKSQRDAEAERVVAHGRKLLGPDAVHHHMTQALRGIAPPDDGGG
ncbi:MULTISPECIES: hypothetical protein [unclassified Roseateles]|uniref:hypothetical protein n=1 Tax=unclassified Roseateles TaxID=2626991 RepID=UPI0006FE50D6|nr:MULTISPECIES: hypothetical protein [unclassified Roseateles]KQW49823.1 hypothetical protein ASC81_25325 [Pelomonas sp. Root405]KRA76490.1 hypothetical protein ASD88_25280 [Pelomonas sp. Root662]